MKKCFIFFTLFVIALIAAAIAENREDRIEDGMTGNEIAMEGQRPTAGLSSK